MAIPYVGRRLIEVLWFSRWFRRLGKKRAIKSQQRKYPGNFVLTYVEGDGREFDYGIDYTECTNCKFLQAENAFELPPNACDTCRRITAGLMVVWSVLFIGNGSCSRYSRSG